MSNWANKLSKKNELSHFRYFLPTNELKGKKEKKQREKKESKKERQKDKVRKPPQPI